MPKFRERATPEMVAKALRPAQLLQRHEFATGDEKHSLSSWLDLPSSREHRTNQVNGRGHPTRSRVRRECEEKSCLTMNSSSFGLSDCRVILFQTHVAGALPPARVYRAAMCDSGPALTGLITFFGLQTVQYRRRRPQAVSGSGSQTLQPRRLLDPSPLDPSLDELHTLVRKLLERSRSSPDSNLVVMNGRLWRLPFEHTNPNDGLALQG